MFVDVILKKDLSGSSPAKPSFGMALTIKHYLQRTDYQFVVSFMPKAGPVKGNMCIFYISNSITNCYKYR